MKKISVSALLELFKEVGYPDIISAFKADGFREKSDDVPAYVFFECGALSIDCVCVWGGVQRGRNGHLERDYANNGVSVDSQKSNSLWLHSNGNFYDSNQKFVVLLLKDGETYKQHFPRLLELQKETEEREKLKSVLSKCEALLKDYEKLPPDVRVNFELESSLRSFIICKKESK